MKVECALDILKKNITLAEKATSKNSSLPILDSILLIAQRNILTIRATNLDLGVEFSIPVKTLKEGSVLVPAQVLQSTLSGLYGDKNIHLETVNENIAVSNKNNSILIKTHTLEDFPTLPIIKDSNTFSIKGQDLLRGFKSVWYSASLSDIKQEIASVFLYGENDTLVFVSTDGFRLAEKKITHKKQAVFQGVIIPQKNIAEIIKILEEVTDDIIVVFNENQIVFSNEHMYITSRVVNGVFPDYGQIIPKEKKTEIVVLKEDLMKAFKAVNVFSDKFNKIDLIVSPKNKIFDLSTRNSFGESTSQCEAALSGDDVKASFNYKYIMDSFQSIKEDSVSLEFNGENKPLVIRGVGNQSFLYLVMPMNK